MARLRQLDLVARLVADAAKREIGVVEGGEGIGRRAGDVRALGQDLLDLQRAHVRPAPRQVVEHVLVGLEERIGAKLVESLGRQSEQLGLDERERLGGFDGDGDRSLVARQRLAVGGVLVPAQHGVDAQPLQRLAQRHDVVERLPQSRG